MQQVIIGSMVIHIYQPGEVGTDAAMSIKSASPYIKDQAVVLGEDFRQLAALLNQTADEMQLPHYAIPFEPSQDWIDEALGEYYQEESEE